MIAVQLLHNVVLKLTNEQGTLSQRVLSDDRPRLTDGFLFSVVFFHLDEQSSSNRAKLGKTQSTGQDNHCTNPERTRSFNNKEPSNEYHGMK